MMEPMVSQDGSRKSKQAKRESWTTLLFIFGFLIVAIFPPLGFFLWLILDTDSLFDVLRAYLQLVSGSWAAVLLWMLLQSLIVEKRLHFLPIKGTGDWLAISVLAVFTALGSVNAGQFVLSFSQWLTSPTADESTATNCHPAYPDVCIPSPPPDLDCAQVRRMGYRNIRVLAPDPHGLDRDGDGTGCE